MSISMGPSQPRPERIQITNEDTANYLAVTRPGITALSPELFGDCKNHLQKEADAGRLTRKILDQFKEGAAKLEIDPFPD